MSNQLNDEPIRSAFVQLHTTEQGRLVAPGVAAARRTVRRRRATAATAVTSAGLAGVAVLAVSLASAAAGPGGPDRGVDLPAAPPESAPTESAPPTAEPPDPGATGDAPGANEAEEAALDAVDFDTRNGQWIPGLSLNDSQKPPGSRYHSFFVNPDSPVWNWTLEDTYIPRVEADSYQIQVWCGDDGGSAEVTLRAGDAELTTTAQCAMTEQEVRDGVGEATLAASSEHEIEVTVVVDETAWTDGARPIVAIVAIPQDVDLPTRPGPDDQS